MGHFNLAELNSLVGECRKGFSLGGLTPEASASLMQWKRSLSMKTDSSVREYMALPLARWENTVSNHAAHHHPWYDFLGEKASAGDFANFFFENRYMPSFAELVRRTYDCQFTDDGRAAVQDNLDDEEKPIPHRELLFRLMKALRPHWNGSPTQEVPRQVLNRQLTYFYGYFLDPWHLVGVIFANEVFSSYHMLRFYEGLQRLQLPKDEIEFARIHVTCDEHHAADLAERVIQRSIAERPMLLRTVAEGVVFTLDTDLEYLDNLLSTHSLEYTDNLRRSTRAGAEPCPSA